MKKFVIISNPRTGSEFVCKMLDSHPNICCYSELFSQGDSGKDWNESHYKTVNKPFDYLKQVFEDSNKEVCGYKQLSFWMNNAGFKNCRNFIRESIDQDYVFIFLERTDLLKSYVSYKIMCSYQYEHLSAVGHLEPKKHIIRLSPEEAFVNVRSWHGFNVYTKEILKEYNAQHIIINYEDDFKDTAVLRKKLFQFLDVINVPISDPLRITNPFKTEELVENYLEVANYFKSRDHLFRNSNLFNDRNT